MRMTTGVRNGILRLRFLQRPRVGTGGISCIHHVYAYVTFSYSGYARVVLHSS